VNDSFQYGSQRVPERLIQPFPLQLASYPQPKMPQTALIIAMIVMPSFDSLPKLAATIRTAVSDRKSSVG
jgi:hypothetical protein